jgi:hypothetical protein
MTLSIDNDRLGSATPPATSDNGHPLSHSRLTRGVQIFTVTAALAGTGCLAFAFSRDEWRSALIGSTLIILSAIGASVWVAGMVLADRQDFYHRGLLDGWMRGWRGQPPDVDDPLVRR